MFTKRQRWDERVHQPAGEPRQGAAGAAAQSQSDNQRTPTIERLADPSGQTFDAIWDKEWRTNLLTSQCSAGKGSLTIQRDAASNL
jgi:hypothetical protein